MYHYSQLVNTEVSQMQSGLKLRESLMMKLENRFFDLVKIRLKSNHKIALCRAEPESVTSQSWLASIYNFY